MDWYGYGYGSLLIFGVFLIFLFKAIRCKIGSFQATSEN